MAVDSAYVIDVAPELVDVSVSRIDRFIDFAKLSVNESVWGTKYDLGVAVMTAHLLTVSGRSGSGGPITSEKVGELAQSYGQVNVSGDEYLATTSYGQWFLQLRRTIPITPLCL